MRIIFNDNHARSIRNYLASIKRKNHRAICQKHPISVIIENQNGDIIDGWNGAPYNIYHPRECSRKEHRIGGEMNACIGIDAEQRAISRALNAKMSLEGGVIYMSEWFPCLNSAKLIIDVGIEGIITPDEIYSNKRKTHLIDDLRNKSYNFELAESLIREAGIDIVIDPRIGQEYKK